jgi:hypothetical protein
LSSCAFFTNAAAASSSEDVGRRSVGSIVII